MLDKKKKIDIEKMKLQAMFVWGKDIEDGSEEIPGIDKPVDPALLGGWG